MQMALLVDGDVLTEAVGDTREQAERRAAHKAIELFKVTSCSLSVYTKKFLLFLSACTCVFFSFEYFIILDFTSYYV